MDGPTHFREAERLLDRADHVTHAGDDPATGAVLAAEAQVHATLALTAATVKAVGEGLTDHERDAWRRAFNPTSASAPPSDDEPYQTAKWTMRPDLSHPHRARAALRAFIKHLDATGQPDPHPHVIDALNSALLAYDPADGSES